MLKLLFIARFSFSYLSGLDSALFELILRESALYHNVLVISKLLHPVATSREMASR
jgi:hypothetical protein